MSYSPPHQLFIKHGMRIGTKLEKKELIRVRNDEEVLAPGNPSLER